MNAKDVLRMSLTTSDMIAMSYLTDLSDADLMRRPHPKCNHLNWQVGHLISAENQLMEMVVPGEMPPLAPGFAEKYVKETIGNDDPTAFADKQTLLEQYRIQRQGTLAALDRVSESDLDRETGVHYAPSLGAMFLLQADHWLMHCGQWVIVRRELGHAPMF